MLQEQSLIWSRASEMLFLEREYSVPNPDGQIHSLSGLVEWAIQEYIGAETNTRNIEGSNNTR